METPTLRRSELAVLEELFAGLTDVEAATRQSAAVRLRSFATDEVRRALDEADAAGVHHAAAGVASDILQRISDLVDSAEHHRKLGAIAAISSLISLEQELHAQMGTRFANYLNSFIRRSDSGPEHEEIVVAAVSALGSLVKAEMGIPPDMIVDFISNALDWIRPSAKKIDELRRR